MDTLTIGAVARRAGVTTEAIRFWERQGVLAAAPRTPSGHRAYTPRVFDELRLLKAAQAVGFSLDEIAAMLALTRSDRVSCSEMCGLAERQLDQLDERIRLLREARGRLAAALAACDHDGTCAVPARLADLGADESPPSRLPSASLP